MEPTAEKSKKSKKQSKSSEIAQSAAAGPRAVPIAVYARELGLDESEIWHRIRRGELSSRTIDDTVHVLDRDGIIPIDAGLTSPGNLPGTLKDELAIPDNPARVTGAVAGVEKSKPSLLAFDSEGLPPLPDDLGPRGTTQALAPVPATEQPSGEVALLLDHLSLAKEENREILKMTRESIRKISDLNDSIIEMKDSVIEAKEVQIAALKQQLADLEAKYRKLSQQKEDLEILAAAIAEESNRS